MPFPRSYKRHEENKRKIGQERSSMQQATTNVIGPLHECKKVCPCTKALPQSGIRAWIKQVRKKRKKRGRETGKTEARKLMERKAAQQNKNTSEELKQGLPRHRLRLSRPCKILKASRGCIPCTKKHEFTTSKHSLILHLILGCFNFFRC